jgi:hypothetical protein
MGLVSRSSLCLLVPIVLLIFLAFPHSANAQNGITSNPDLNGDGMADILWYSPSTGQTVAWLMDGTTVSSSAELFDDPDWRVFETGDFNGDGMSDLLWYNASTGQTAAWLMNGTSVSAWTVLLADYDWKVVASADFNGDGKADLLWHNDSTGQTAMWLMNGTTTLAWKELLTDSDWKVIAAADFNGDGKADLLWQNDVIGQTGMWLMNGTSTLTWKVLFSDQDWRVIGAADFNGDGKADLLWHNNSTGQTAAWLMNGTTAAAWTSLPSDSNWRVIAAADLNGDSKADLLWRNDATGQTTAWLMNGTGISSSVLLMSDPNWIVTAAADLNHDGNADLLWYNTTTGQTYAWLMNGTSLSNGASLLTASGWGLACIKAASWTPSIACDDTELNETTEIDPANEDLVVNASRQVNNSPTVSAGSNQAITLPASASLNGTASDDGLPSGSSLVRTWSKVSGPGTVTFGSVNAQSTTASFSMAGTYVLQLAVSDSALTSTATVTIVVNAAQQVNQPPTVSAGSNQTITLPASASLNGTASDDGLPSSSLLLLTWSKVSGPGSVTFGNLHTQSTTASFSIAGMYILQLAATDGATISSSMVTITVSESLSFTYYVDSANGLDSNPGTLAQPWKTIAKANSVKLTQGQSIGFKRGSLWRGEALMPGQSGTAGNPITFGAYGSGADPQILGSVAASSPGAWEAASIPFSISGSVTQANTKLSIAAGKAFADLNATISLTSYIGGLLTIKDSGGHTLTGYISAAGTGETYGSQLLSNPGLNTTSNLSANKATLSTVASGGQSGGPYLEVALTGAYGGGLQSFSVSNGMLLKSSAYLERGTETSGMWLKLANQSWIDVAGTAEVLPRSWDQYTVYATADSTSSKFELFYNGATLGQTSLFDTASVLQVLTPSTTGVTIVSAYGGSIQSWASEQTGFNRNDPNGYTYIIIGSGSLPNRWQSTALLSTTPNAVFRDNLPLTQVASAAAVSNTSQYYYSNGVVYVYAIGNPTAGAHGFEITKGTGEVTSDFLVNLNNVNYVTLNNLSLKYANRNGILISNSTNVVVDGVDVSYTWGTGIQNLGWGYDYSSFITVENSVFNWNGAGGIRFGGGGGGSKYGQLHDLVIQGNTVTYAGWETTISPTTGGIYVWGVYGGPSVSFNATIQNNNVGFTQFGPGNTGNAAGIYMDEWGVGGVIKYNSSHDNAGPGILFEHQDGNAAYYNLLWNNATSPDAFQFQFAFYRDTSNMVGANNTCYGGVNCYGVVGQSGSGQSMIGNTLENNIAIGYGGMALQGVFGGENAGGGSGNIYGHNDFGFQAPGFIGWGQGTFYGTYSAWEKKMGNSSYSINADPLLNSPPTDMTLQPGSPAIGAGVYIPGVSTANPPNVGAK